MYSTSYYTASTLYYGQYIGSVHTLYDDVRIGVVSGTCMGVYTMKYVAPTQRQFDILLKDAVSRKHKFEMVYIQS